MKNKSQLAKLLATENIEVQENAVKTASFDVKNRILTVPIFKEEHKSKHVYDMLVGHEVAHALHTPTDSWESMGIRKQEFRSFVNVIEDARIDKLIQKKYPGLVNDYLKGFDKMYKDNFFGTNKKDVMTYALIDKINLYYKSSKRLNFNFTKKENYFVKAVDDCKSFDDVLKLAEDILGHCKEELKKNPVIKKTYVPIIKKKEGEDKKDDNSSTSMPGNDEDKKDNNESKDKLQEWLDKKDQEENPSPKPKDNNDNKDDSKDDKNGEVGNDGAGGEPAPVLRSVTNEQYDTAIKGITDDKSRDRSYCELPKVNLKKLIVPWDKLIRDVMVYDHKNHNTDYDRENLNKAKIKTQQFIKESSNVVNYLVKEFEMKKNAKLYARQSQDKTGVIDPLKLHSYKFAEDIFKKITTVPNQKNHGMILLLDWSGSMQKHLLPTVEQLLNLTLFCKKINIPFSVYAFMNNHDSYHRKDRYENSGFSVTPKSLLPDASTKLVHLFSHKQSKVDYMRVAQIIHRAALYFNSHYNWRSPETDKVPSMPSEYYLSSTPLNESLIAMDHIIKKFKNDYRTDKVALVTLTDGASNSMHKHNPGEIWLKLNNKYINADSYWGDKNDLTSVMLRYLKRKYDLQTIGFYLVSKYRELRYQIRVPYEKEILARKMFSKDKFIADYSTSYDVYFYVNSGTRVSNKVMDDSIDTTNKRILKKMFMSGMKKRINSRVLLQNFIKRIA